MVSLKRLILYLTDTILETGASGVPSKSQKTFIGGGMGLGFMYCIQNKGSHCSLRAGVEGGASSPGNFRVIVCPIPPQINDFCDLLGTLDAPV